MPLDIRATSDDWLRRREEGATESFSSTDQVPAYSRAVTDGERRELQLSIGSDHR